VKSTLFGASDRPVVHEHFTIRRESQDDLNCHYSTSSPPPLLEQTAQLFRGPSSSIVIGIRSTESADRPLVRLPKSDCESGQSSICSESQKGDFQHPFDLWQSIVFAFYELTRLRKFLQNWTIKLISSFFVTWARASSYNVDWQRNSITSFPNSINVQKNDVNTLIQVNQHVDPKSNNSIENIFFYSASKSIVSPKLSIAFR
jgi:hypothetical protein